MEAFGIAQFFMQYEEGHIAALQAFDTTELVSKEPSELKRGSFVTNIQGLEITNQPAGNIYCNSCH